MTSRVTALLLIMANGLWDPVLQMIFSAVILVSISVFVLIVLGRNLDGFGYAVLAALLTALTAVPYGYESVLMGMNTQFYCVILFSFLAMYLISREDRLSASSISGLVAGTLAYFSVVSGALVFLACFAVVAIRMFLGLTKGRQPWILAVLLLLAFVLALAFTPTIEGHKVLRAHSANEFRDAYLAIESWPLLPYLNLGALIVNGPWILLAWRTLRRPAEAGNVAWVLLAFGLWNGLQFGALAFGRASLISSSRYLDSAAFNVVLNYVCLAMLCDRRRVIQLVWIGIVCTGLYVQSRPVWMEVQNRLDTSLKQEANVKSFLATGHFLPGASGSDRSLPYPDADRLSNLLSDPRVKAFLPSNLQAAMPGEASRRDRLGVVRDLLLRSGPYLTGCGLLLLSMLITGRFLRFSRHRQVQI